MNTPNLKDGDRATIRRHWRGGQNTDALIRDLNAAGIDPGDYDPAADSTRAWEEGIAAIGDMMRRQCLRESHGACILCRANECRRPAFLEAAEGRGMTRDPSDVVARVLEEVFPEVGFRRVESVSGTAADGEPVWHIAVVLDPPEFARLDALRATTVLRHLLPRLQAAGYRGWPLISYIDRTELEAAEGAR